MGTPNHNANANRGINFQNFDTRELVSMCAKYLPKDFALNEEEFKLLSKQIEYAMPRINKAIGSIVQQYESAMQSGKAQEINTKDMMSLFLKEMGPCLQEMMDGIDNSLEPSSKK